MNEPTNIQTIMQDGKPAFVVIPFDEYMRLFPKTPRVPEGDAIPHEVVGLTIKKGYTLVRAWREYLGLTQKEVAKRMGITQAAFRRWRREKSVCGKRPWRSWPRPWASVSSSCADRNAKSYRLFKGHAGKTDEGNPIGRPRIGRPDHIPIVVVQG